MWISLCIYVSMWGGLLLHNLCQDWRSLYPCRTWHHFPPSAPCAFCPKQSISLVWVIVTQFQVVATGDNLPSVVRSASWVPPPFLGTPPKMHEPWRVLTSVVNSSELCGLPPALPVHRMAALASYLKREFPVKPFPRDSPKKLAP